ncbi:hypothetical protein E2562_032544 [Oryza meyeriana var. granulata]|uniref:Uncharacterized protein n=1 Tax=Oryza meyeriana var. granulata TaxID=110450 RepID=A0A6G1CVN7_9ORYZ|nr:hypothetical protein E2562_032544 [Oryza meyeriana var. granulata]
MQAATWERGLTELRKGKVGDGSGTADLGGRVASNWWILVSPDSCGSSNPDPAFGGESTRGPPDLTDALSRARFDRRPPLH